MEDDSTQEPRAEAADAAAEPGLVESFVGSYPTHVLETLLADRTTGRNIVWANDEYSHLGESYGEDDQMTVPLIAGENAGLIRPRVQKRLERQSSRTKSRAEVFTPSWLCNQMNNDLDEAWFGRRDVFTIEGPQSWETSVGPVCFPKTRGRGWHAYVESPMLEITCGEAAFVCSRYDTVTGDALPVRDRVGFLDRKLRVVSEQTKTRKTWAKWALAALRATHGFEYQGDNLLIARINVLRTFCEHMSERWGKGPTPEELDEAAWVVSWNFWQMNGLTLAVPSGNEDVEPSSGLGLYSEPAPEPSQGSIFDLLGETSGEAGEFSGPPGTVPLCVIYDWNEHAPFEYACLRNGTEDMAKKKFYAVIGNPPYQIGDGGHEASAAPVYHCFVQEAKQIADNVVMVTPSRWFSGGKGLDSYRQEMISDHHLKDLVDFPKLYEPFPNVKIRGGVSYFVWDKDYVGPCKVQTIEDGKLASSAVERYLDKYDVLIRRNEAVPILDKVAIYGEPTLANRISARKPFGLPTNYHGPTSPDGLMEPIKLYESQREGWIAKEEIKSHPEWIDDWKVLLNRVQGTSAAVETKFMSNPIIAAPGSACTETYLVAGRFDSREKAEYYVSYLKTRFVRFLISLRKVSQDAARGVYAFVPDLEYDHIWTDQELYARYGISDEEARYIESVVKEMG